MNEMSPDEMPPDEGFDPELLRLFDQASAAGAPDEAFVANVLVELRKARRARLVARSIVAAAIMVAGAFLAPYVARATLAVMGSIAIYPVGFVCATLLAWRTQRRFN